ncbi:TPA: hypothetical protein LWH10_001336 [Listeria innocua]|uniref:Uncharacterized protein n=1 Tax=Listeria monocytogenes serotype 1/2a TaxID=1906951 RepID=A0A9P1YLV0_LISMN|nr:hypothetical protein [Listeria monocytogenes]EAF3074219.1 hypothetical protein [Listeria monocytogenes serotype 1/2a]EIS4901915.1 hypothetical protein [Listeria innocua]EAF5051086.1 hypothetical protein [Listeria monocytogenes]ECQ8346247.1 hypothetical protein [Listeria monocytogenes]EGF6981713.1 hypothetical protein [Listeria monocytogenes]
MDKADIFNLAESLNCEYEIGLWSEINSFFEYQEDNISSFDLKFQKEGKDINNYYSLDVNMKNFSYQAAQNLFHQLVQFIEYKSATIYIQEKRATDITIYLLSATSENKGFLIQMKIQ